jgi:protein-disulfide isomerase
MSILKVPVNGDDNHQGNRNAAITLVEYGDYQCPHCRRAYPLVKRLLEEKGEELNFVFRNFPLKKIHPLAFSAAVSAEAAGKQKKFWEMHDVIFENQNKITAHFLLILAGEIGLDIAQLERDLQSEEIRIKIENDFYSGILSGVNGTPSFFINGSRLLAYDETYESLLNAIVLESNKLNGWSKSARQSR